ncbi:MAG: ion transporter [Gammaproteobacteria bacterium]
MKEICAAIVANKWFDRIIIALIILNAAILGFETSPVLNAKYGNLFALINQTVLGVFILEAVLKIIAVSPHVSKYFKNGWNLFDFSVIVLSLVPATGQFAMIARLARLLRVLRLISALPELRLIVSTLLRSIPGMANVMLLMSVIFYIYAIMGFHLFHEHDPEHWRNVGISLLTLFRIVTLEDWTDVMYKGMELAPFAWVYFVSFVVFGTFVIINLFIAIVINNLDEAKAEKLNELRQPTGRDEILKELQEVEATLGRLQGQLRDSFELNTSANEMKKV